MRIYDLVDTAVLKSLSELDLAIGKHGIQEEKTPNEQMTIIVEELGETAQAINDKDYEQAQKEIAQTIAMCYKMYWYLEKEKIKNKGEIENE